MTKDGLREAFIKRLGLNINQMEIVNGDLSHRRYFRIRDNEKSVILMEDDPQSKSFGSFISMTNFLRSQDFSAPEIHEVDLDNGFILMEDFGVERIGDLLSSNKSLPDEIDEEKIYRRAVDVLARIHKLEPELTLQELSDEQYIAESMKFVVYYAEIINGDKLPVRLTDEFQEIMKYLLNRAKNLKSVMTLRDYHVENLFWFFDRSGIQKIGLIDYQDAMISSPTYDLVSILEDARRDVSVELGSKMISHYLKSFPEFDRKDFMMAYHIFGAQRNLKIIGQFSHYAETKKQSRLLQLLPRVIGYLKNDLKHPILLPLKEWIEKAVPQKGVVSALTYGSGKTKIIV